MNNDRRLRIKKNNERIKLVCELLEIYKKEMELIQEDEEEAYDNLPDSFQNGIILCESNIFFFFINFKNFKFDFICCCIIKIDIFIFIIDIIYFIIHMHILFIH